MVLTVGFLGICCLIAGILLMRSANKQRAVNPDSGTSSTERVTRHLSIAVLIVSAGLIGWFLSQLYSILVIGDYPSF